MEVNRLREILIANAKRVNACTDGINELCTAGTKEDIARCYMEYIDFCLVNDYPRNSFSKRYFEKELEDIGVYIDRTITLKEGNRIVFLGGCYGTVEIGGYSVCMLRAKHQSRINIKASGHARIMVDALDSADIIVDVSEDATVIVNLYGTSTCKGATKVIKKGRTYEL